MTIERRRYQLVVELPVDIERFGPTDVPDELVALENFVTDELGGSIVDETVLVTE